MATPQPLGFDPVTHNTEWEPVIQDFDGVEMALVPAGCFMMGTPEEEIVGTIDLCETYYGECFREWFEGETPQHEVCFEEPYWIDVYEVTNTEFAAFLKSQGDQTENGATFFDASSRHAHIHERVHGWSIDNGNGNHPAIEVTWYGASAYCEWLGAHLPTEAEWEYATRGPDGLIYPWGNQFIADYVVWGENSGRQTAEVGSRPEGISWVGVYDMSGNVSEWVTDWYDANYYSTLSDAVINPQGPNIGIARVVRGGSSHTVTPTGLRGTYRIYIHPTDSYDTLGFRCARDY